MCAKNACSAGVSTHCPTPTALKLPGGGHCQNRVHNCARSSPTLPGSAEAHSGDTGGVFGFFCCIYVAQGGWGSSLFIPDTALGLEGLKGQDTRGWLKTTQVFWHFLSPQHLETRQGVSMDSLGVGAIEIGRIFTPDHHRSVF